MFKAFKDMFIAFFSWLKIPIFIILFIIGLFYLLVFFNILFGLIKGKRFNKAISYQRQKKTNFLKKLFFDLPKRISDDMFKKNPDMFSHHGMIIFEGRQGQGKTISAIQYAREMQREYTLSKCITNVGYKYQNDELNHWSQLVDYVNGIYGVIVLIDETQNWFASNQSKNFPPEMLEVVTQNRKNRRVILGTAQSFYMLAKNIRSQTTELRRCATLFGCLTIVRRYTPILDSDGNVKEFKKRGWYFFVHDDDLRDSYDTYHVIHSLSKSGFQDKDYLSPETEKIVNNLVLLDKRKKRGK